MQKALKVKFQGNDYYVTKLTFNPRGEAINCVISEDRPYKLPEIVHLDRLAYLEYKSQYHFYYSDY